MADYDFDFGFTAVESMDEVTPPPPAPTITKEEISEPILARMESLEGVVLEVLQILDRIENASTSLDTDEYKQLIEKDVREKLLTVEKMIMPLLQNLLKDADTKDYIKWPNRRPIIEAFTEKLLKVTRS